MDQKSISEQDLDALLERRDPIDRTAFRARELTPALTALSEAIATVDPTPRLREHWSAPHPPRTHAGTGRPRRGARRRARLAVGAGALAGAATVAASLIGFGGSGSRSPVPGWIPTVTPTQAATLDAIAARAAQQSGPGKGQWLFQRYTLTGAGTGFVGTTSTQVHWIDTSTVEQWTNPQATVVRTRTAVTGMTFDSARDQALFDGPLHAQLAADTIMPGEVSDDADPSSGADPSSAENMPQTPAALLNRCRALAEHNPVDSPRFGSTAELKRQVASDLFSELTSLLAQSTSAPQRSAALKDLAYVPGAQVLGRRRDADGRVGTAIRFVWPYGTGAVLTIVVDPRTGDLLQQQSSSLRSDGTVAKASSFDRITYLQRAIVASMTALPGGRTQPYHGLLPRLAPAHKASK